jgi:hypothetical protein
MTQNKGCSTCADRGDCEEFESQAVRDISVRCGLMCHSSLRSIPEALNEFMIKEHELQRLEQNGVSKIAEAICGKVRSRGSLSALSESLCKRSRIAALKDFGTFVKTEWVRSTIDDFIKECET